MTSSWVSALRSGKTSFRGSVLTQGYIHIILIKDGILRVQSISWCRHEVRLGSVNEIESERNVFLSKQLTKTFSRMNNKKDLL